MQTKRRRRFFFNPRCECPKCSDVCGEFKQHATNLHPPPYPHPARVPHVWFDGLNWTWVRRTDRVGAQAAGRSAGCPVGLSAEPVCLRSRYVCGAGMSAEPVCLRSRYVCGAGMPAEDHVWFNPVTSHASLGGRGGWIKTSTLCCTWFSRPKGASGTPDEDFVLLSLRACLS